MTEADYILARDLSNVMHARAMLKECNRFPHNPCISDSEIEIVLEKLEVWENDIFEAIDGALGSAAREPSEDQP